ncbi:hypothetical protein FS837_000918 [Tulasnella sp. UAMH 9824]|nr:hypothetical protein FS837_000918 [Tulasnella sp. UAMH 9824]
MMEAYTTSGPYSIDLVKAVQRQMKFVDSMVSLGWTDYGRFESESDESGLALKRAVAQYHAFLDVMAVNRESFLVPTLPTTGSVAKLFGRKGKTKEVIPEIQNHRPDLLSHNGDDVYETHPSEHSKVKVINSSSALKMASAREKMANKRLQEDQDAVSSGAADGWQALLVQVRSVPNDNHQLAFSESERTSPCGHLDLKDLGIGQCAMDLPGSA